MVHRYGIRLARKIPGSRKASQTRPKDGDAEAFGRQGQWAALRADRQHAGKLKAVHGNAAAKVAAQTGVFTRGVTKARHDAGQRQMALHKLTGLAGLALGHTRHEGAHVQIKRTGIAAARGAFLCTAGFDFMQALLIHHDVNSLKTD